MRKDTMNPPESAPHTLHLKHAVPESRRTALAEQLTPRIPNMTLEHCTRLLGKPGILIQSRYLDRLIELRSWLEQRQVEVEIIAPVVARGAPERSKLALRFGIQSRLMLLMLVPLLLLALAVGLLGRPSLERAFTLLLDRSAAQVAYTVASSLRPDDLTGTIKQLDLIGSYENIGFIAVQPQDDSRLYLAYRDPAYGLTWRVVNNGTAPVRASNDPGDQILQALQTNPQLRSLNVQDTRLEPLRKSTNTSIRNTAKRLEPFDHQSRVFAVREARVFEAQNGTRTVLVDPGSDAPKESSPVFSLRIGVFDDQSRALGVQQLQAALALLALSLILAGLLAVFAARSVSRPITGLIGVANQISLGELQQPVQRTSNDEIGDLSEAIERMRVSLKILIARHRSKT
jgi:HAMP domain-containing protein